MTGLTMGMCMAAWSAQLIVSSSNSEDWDGSVKAYLEQRVVMVVLLWYVLVFGVLLMVITCRTAPIYHEPTNLGFTLSLVLLAIFNELVTGLLISMVKGNSFPYKNLTSRTHLLTSGKY
jgi:hypothetical protein